MLIERHPHPRADHIRSLRGTSKEVRVMLAPEMTVIFCRHPDSAVPQTPDRADPLLVTGAAATWRARDEWRAEIGGGTALVVTMCLANSIACVHARPG
jgi:hypothetical protein